MVAAVSYKHTLVACSLLLCPLSAMAGTPSLNLTLSHTDTSELKPISPFNIARAQFLPDIDDNPYSYFDRIQEDHNRGNCDKNGFQYTRENCPAPRILKNKCPFGTGYADCYCAGSPTCSGRTSSYSNPYPSSTGASQSTCKDCGGKTLYNWNCDSSACSGYMIYGSCPSHGNCSRCCDGYYKLNSCDNGYEISGSGGQAKCILSETCFGETTRNSDLGYSCSSCTNKSGQTLYTCSCTGSCSLSSCPANGYCSTDCRGKYCLNSCKSGYSVSGNSCSKDCVPNSCSGYSLYSQPANGTYETCSVGCGSGTYKYRLTGCNSGYYLDGTGCTKCDKVNTTCDTGKTLVNTCTTDTNITVGDCVDCRDESSPYNPCYGYYICEGDKVGSGATCNCGSQTFYEKCLVKETCLYSYKADSSCQSGVRYSDIEGYNYCQSKGYEINKSSSTCQRNGFTMYQTCSSCTSGSCKGYKKCYKDQGTELCECGGEKYFKDCQETCSYAYREDSSCPSGVRYSDIQGYDYCQSKGYEINKSSSTCQRNGFTMYQTCSLCTSGSCKGYKKCYKDQGTELCECGGEKYFKDCQETCSYAYREDSSCPSGVRYSDIQGYDYCQSKGYEINKSSSTCQRNGFTMYQTCSSCTSGSCKGYKKCAIAGGETCTCGGETYGTICLTECNYEDTPASCSAQGKVFTLKCSDESGNQFGECS